MKSSYELICANCYEFASVIPMLVRICHGFVMYDLNALTKGRNMFTNEFFSLITVCPEKMSSLDSRWLNRSSLPCVDALGLHSLKFQRQRKTIYINIPYLVCHIFLFSTSISTFLPWINCICFCKASTLRLDKLWAGSKKRNWLT